VPVVVFVVLVVVVTVARICSVVASSCSCPSLMAGRIGGNEIGSKQTGEEEEESEE